MYPLHQSPSYRSLICCGQGQQCLYGDKGSCTPEQPCWGQVAATTVDDGEGGAVPLHACQGHLELAEGRPYIPEPARA